jgi:hypothetical protein
LRTVQVSTTAGNQHVSGTKIVFLTVLLALVAGVRTHLGLVLTTKKLVFV